MTRHDYAVTRMQFTITEAAKLYGKQRKTIYRHLDTGRLSAGVRGDGKRVIDLSELIRCYGEPSQALPTSASDTKKTHDTPQSDTPLTHSLIAELVELNRRQADQLERMADRIERLELALLALPPPSTPEAPKTDAHATIEPPADNEPPKTMADVLARFERR